MTTQCSLERLEPRWAPARLLGGALPAQFGVDLTALAAAAEDAVDSMPDIVLPVVESFGSGAMSFMMRIPGTDGSAWSANVRHLFATLPTRELVPPAIIFDAIGANGEGGGETSVEQTFNLFGGTLSLGTSNSWSSHTATTLSGAVVTLGAGSLNLSTATLSGSVSLVSGTLDVLRARSAEMFLNANTELNGELLLGGGASNIQFAPGGTNYLGYNLGAVTMTRASSSGLYLTDVPANLVASLVAAGVIPPAPAEAAVEEIPENNLNTFLEASPNPIEPPQP